MKLLELLRVVLEEDGIRRLTAALRAEASLAESEQRLARAEDAFEDELRRIIRLEVNRTYEGGEP